MQLNTCLAFLFFMCLCVVKFKYKFYYHPDKYGYPSYARAVVDYRECSHRARPLHCLIGSVFTLHKVPKNAHR